MSTHSMHFSNAHQEKFYSTASVSIGLIVYDALVLDGKDLTEKLLMNAVKALHEWLTTTRASDYFYRKPSASLKAS